MLKGSDSVRAPSGSTAAAGHIRAYLFTVDIGRPGTIGAIHSAGYPFRVLVTPFLLYPSALL